MTTKNAKTVLFTTMMMVMILPLSMNVVDAVPTQASDKIPVDKLLDRQASEWQTKYKDIDEFQKRQNAIIEYVTADLPNNGWNQFMVKESIRIHNFDTMIGKAGQSHELVALVVEKERILDTYDATESVAKFHDWLLSKYEVPKTVEEIDQRISDIVSDRHLHLVPELVSSFNTIANKGNIPPELANEDPEYWIMVANVAVCEFNPDCNISDVRPISTNDQFNLANTMHPIYDMLNYFLPEAYAITYQQSVGYLYGNPNSCDYGQCWRSDNSSGTNPHTTAISSPSGGHAYGSLYVYASTCSGVSGVSTSVYGTVDMGPDSSFTKSGDSCAVHSQYYSLPNPNASYLWSVTATHYAWT